MSMHKIELTEWEREGLELHRLPIGKPSQLSDTFRAGVQFATRKSNETIVDLAKRNCALQAKIDSLTTEAEHLLKKSNRLEQQAISLNKKARKLNNLIESIKEFE